MRKRTGNRNRYRSGRGTYSKRGKGPTADRYGSWDRGRQDRPDVVAGRTLAYRVHPEASLVVTR